MAYGDVIETAAATSPHEHGFGGVGSKAPEERFADLQAMTRSYLSDEDEETLARAFEFANKAHKGQKRRSGEPFIAHPIEVAIILGRVGRYHPLQGGADWRSRFL